MNQKKYINQLLKHGLTYEDIEVLNQINNKYDNE
jgi:hypothetical protein